MAFVEDWEEFPFGSSRRRAWPIRRTRDLDEEGRIISIIWPENELPAVKRQRIMSSDSKVCDKCNSVYSNGVMEADPTNGHAVQNGEEDEKKEKEFKVQIVTKSFLPDEVSVKITGGVLSIRAHHEERNKEHGTYVYRALNRQYVLPDGVLPDTVTSELTSDGVLTIQAPLSAKAKTVEERVVPVKLQNVVETSATNGDSKMETEEEKIKINNTEKDEKLVDTKDDPKEAENDEKNESENKEAIAENAAKKAEEGPEKSDDKNEEGEPEKMDETDKS